MRLRVSRRARHFGCLVLSLTSCNLAGCTSAQKRLPEHHEGTDFLVVVNDQAFVVRLVTPEPVVLARDRVAGTQPQGIVSGKLAEGDGGFNRDPGSGEHWTWHLIPDTVNFPQLAMEVCDGRPSDVEGALDP